MIMDFRQFNEEKRSSNKFKEIRTVKSQTGMCHRIAISREAANNFSGCNFSEVIVEQGIFLVKSGCDIDNIIIHKPQKEAKLWEQIK